MFRHLVRHVVKPGEFRSFAKALKALNESAADAGLPRYRASVTRSSAT